MMLHTLTNKGVIMYKIAVCDHIHQAGLDLLSSQSDIEMQNLADLPKDELLNHLKDADVAITRSSTGVDSRILDSNCISYVNLQCIS